MPTYVVRRPDSQLFSSGVTAVGSSKPLGDASDATYLSMLCEYPTYQSSAGAGVFNPDPVATFIDPDGIYVRISRQFSAVGGQIPSAKPENFNTYLFDSTLAVGWPLLLNGVAGPWDFNDSVPATYQLSVDQANSPGMDQLLATYQDGGLVLYTLIQPVTPDTGDQSNWGYKMYTNIYDVWIMASDEAEEIAPAFDLSRRRFVCP